MSGHLPSSNPATGPEVGLEERLQDRGARKAGHSGGLDHSIADRREAQGALRSQAPVWISPPATDVRDDVLAAQLVVERLELPRTPLRGPPGPICGALLAV